MLMFLTVMTAFAGDKFIFIATENRINTDGVTPSLIVFTDSKLADHWSVSTFSAVSTGYSQAYIGPVWKPNDQLALSVSAGIESSPSLWRVAAKALYADKGFKGFVILEDGGTGPWYRVDITERIGCFKFGVLAKRYNGLGVRLGFAGKHFELWTAPLYDPEAKRPNLMAVFSWTP